MVEGRTGLEEARPAFEMNRGQNSSIDLADLGTCGDPFAYPDTATAWPWRADARLRLTHLGPPFRAQTGINSFRLRGRSLWNLARESVLDGATLAAHLEDLQGRRPFRDVRYRLVDPASGTERHVQASGRPMFDRGGAFLGYRGTGVDITAQVEARRDAARAESRLRDAIESIRDGFALFDEDDRLVICNHRYGEIEGLDPDKVTAGLDWQSMLKASIKRGHYPAAMEADQDYLAQRLEHHQSADGTVIEEQLADGRWIQIREYRTSDGGAVGTRTDITELKRRERTQAALSDELRTQYLRFDAALNNMIQGLCMFDADHRLIVCNARYLKMYGFSPDVVKPGIRLREIMEYSVSLGNYKREDAPRAIDERPTTADMREQAVLHQRLNDGRVIAVMHQPMDDGGSVATYEDVTQTVRAEEGLRTYAARLERSNRELEDFASIASHDLQEPLRKIEAFGDRLIARCGDELSDVGGVYIERMQDAAGRMRCLINDLLSYSRVTTKARPFVSVNLDQTAREVISDLQVAIEQANARITLRDLPEIEADPTQMRQLLQNLLSNALKFRCMLRRPEIVVSGRVYGASPRERTTFGPQICEITVTDNGIGFKQDYAERIFGVFRRLHGRGEYPGTGIGLATCRKILERHSGTIIASGKPEEGAIFVCTLPAAQVGNMAA